MQANSSTIPWTPGGKHRHERPRPQYRPDAGEPAITVQNVSVQDGGNAIVGNVTQHASVIVSDKNEATAVTAARSVPMPDLSERKHEPVDARRQAKA